MSTGEIRRVAGPVVVARGLDDVRLANLVRVGADRLPGEAIRIDGDDVVIQVYEGTGGLRAGDPVEDARAPLSVELGPGLLGEIFDGTQRPLRTLAAAGGRPLANPFVERTGELRALDRGHRHEFRPSVDDGQRVGPGDLLGTVALDGPLEHRVLVPPDRAGVVEDVAAGPVGLEDVVARVGGEPVCLLSRWPVRRPRPHAGRRRSDVPLITGQRVVDTLFPLALGGAATIPGGFGTGKTVLETSLAKWAHADVVVYVACGERGNELTEVLEEFPDLEDPRTGAPLMQRTVLIANTSNMPVAAREASIYTGITIAEYFRDQGYDVALMADSTSRWGEALREVSGRLEELPAEEGYPAYLATRIAQFYERAGSVTCLGRDERRGSVSIVGAVSPPSGDFSEPVTQYSLRMAGTFWALDSDLARQRHFPAIDPGRSYTQYALDDWFAEHVGADWPDLRRWALELLGRERELLEIVQLLGSEALAAPQHVTLRVGRLLREDFLQQSAFDARDASSTPGLQLAMLRVLRAAHDAMSEAIEREVPADAVTGLRSLADLARMRSWDPAEADARAEAQVRAVEEEVRAL